MDNWERLAKRLIFALESSRIREYANMLGSTRRIIWVSFVSGIFRGLGGAIGFSALGAIALFILSRIFGIEFGG